MNLTSILVLGIKSYQKGLDATAGILMRTKTGNVH